MRLTLDNSHNGKGHGQRWLNIRNLSVQLGLIAIAVPTLVLSFFGIYQVRSSTDYLEKQLDQALKNEAVQLAASVSTALFNFDDETLVVTCKSALRKPEIIKITVWDLDQEYAVLEDDNYENLSRSTGTKQINYPITFNSETLGTIQVVATMAMLESEIRAMKLSQMFQIVVLDLIVGLILLFVLNLRFVKPLQGLKQSSEEFAAGHLDYPIDVKRDDELGTLAKNLASMRDSVKEQMRSLKGEVDRHQKTSLALEKSESFLRLIIDMIPHMIFVKDRDGRFVVVNQAVAEWFDSSVEEITGRRHIDVTNFTNEAADMLKIDQEVMDEGQPRTTVVGYRGERWFSTKRMPYKTTDGETRVVGISIDISDIKQVEEELKKTNNYIDSIINSMPSALFSVDSSFNVTKWNHQASQYYGKSFDDVVSRPLGEVLPGMEPFMGDIEKSIKSGEPCFFPKQVRSTTSGMVYEEIIVYPLMGENIEGAVIRVDDVTEHVRMEEMVVQSEKMLSVGGLAAGMAHEINNPLAGMMQNAQVVINRIMGEIPASARAAQEAGITMDQIRGFMEKRGIIRQLELIHEAGVRASQIVQNMLSFARKDFSGKVEQDMAQILDQTLEVARSDYNLKKKYDFKKIRVVREYEEGVPPAVCEVSKIQQVFFNILKNSAEAMQDHTPDRAPVFYLRIKNLEKFVSIEIEDNGPGMDEEVRKRLFEPFFTTKPVGKGTGLGLSVSYFIITENHGGEMHVTSESGRGTKFIINLPVS